VSSDEPRPTATRLAALEVSQHVVYHGGVVHQSCDCEDYRARVQQRVAALRAGQRLPRPPFALPVD
jgi:hypothetical protein